MKSLLDYWKKLNTILTIRDKWLIVLLLGLSIILSIIETVGISVLMPFISVATTPSLTETNKYYRAAFDTLGFRNTSDFIIYFGLLLVGFYIFRGAYNIFYTHALNRFSLGRYNFFARMLFEKYIGYSCIDLYNRNSSVLMQRIITESSNLSAFIQHVLFLLSEVFTAALIYTLLLFVNVKVTLFFTLFMIIQVFFLTRTTSKLMKQYSVKLNLLQSNIFKIMTEVFGNFKLIKLIGNEKPILKDFGDKFKEFVKGFIANASLVALPKNILEAIGFSSLILTVVFFVYRREDIALILPIISVYALALYRMLPSVNRILTSYNNISFFSNSLNIIYDDLQYQTEEEFEEGINFNRGIEVGKVTFSYDGRRNVLNNVRLTISKGAKVAFVGESGGGKSTLADLIIGIHKPDHGQVLIDGVLLSNKNVRAWRKKIGYIPQSIYLFDGTVAQNVAFGKDYDEGRVIEALRKANIYDFLLGKAGIDTLVGEGGVKLSVGQKQRIGIARALYDDPEFLVLDEATSALDTETESRIMDEIFDLSRDKTLLIIAHRLSTTDRCEEIYTLRDGMLKNNDEFEVKAG